MDAGGKCCRASVQEAFPNKIAEPTIPDWWKRKSHVGPSPLRPASLPSGRSATLVATTRARARSI
eukprot:10643858-Lingulodinium_polyedra.AAC.1